jgi:hypothetical protein
MIAGLGASEARMKRIASAGRWIAGAMALAAAPHAHADEAPADEAPADDERFGLGFNLVVENDLFNDGDDQNYTSGVQVSVSTARFAAPDWSVDVARSLGVEKDTRLLTEFGFSQAMFTPRDLTRVAPDPADRPYAGLALLSMALIGDTPRKGPDGLPLKNSRFDQFVYFVGVAGPDAGAKEAQDGVHRARGAALAQGWDTQIPERIVGGIAFRTTRNLYPGQSVERDSFFDLLPHAGFTLGSVTTDAEVGATARIGYNRPRDFGQPRIAPSLPGSAYFTSDDPWGAYAFIGAAQRYVAYDITLDERPSRGAGRVDRREFVTDAQLGFLVYAGCLRGGYTHVWRSEQFRGQREGSGFGAVSISYSLPKKGRHWLTCA